MAHYLTYLELASYVGTGLGAFRLLSQFAIKMIAIFGGDKFSARAFEVLKISRRGHDPEASCERAHEEAHALPGAITEALRSQSHHPTGK